MMKNEAQLHEEETNKWRNINCTFKRIMNQTPENDGVVLKVDFVSRTYEVVDETKVLHADFKAPRKKRSKRY